MSGIVCVINSCNLSKFREFLDFVLGISAFNDDVSVVFGGVAEIVQVHAVIDLLQVKTVADEE